MGWVILFIVIAIVGACLDSGAGKLVLSAGALGIGFLIIRWITDIGFFASIAKLCGVAVIVVILWMIVSAIFGS